jgi:hypothetical protein
MNTTITLTETRYIKNPRYKNNLYRGRKRSQRSNGKGTFFIL